MIGRKQLIKKYIEFFKSKDHKEIPNTSLIPADDPSVLFTTAGMHPLVLFLLGQKHPLGKRLVSVQKCIRTGDIEEVGDDVHLTFFEMLGNWSLGGYWKKECIEWSYEFLTKELKIAPKKLTISCFKGDTNAPRDEESAEIWKSLGISKIKFLGKKDNWWGPAGKTGPCGPDSEMFVKGVEIWNDVFMQYDKREKVLLVDGMHCLYDKDFKVNERLSEIINKIDTRKILVINAFGEKARKLLDRYGIEVFTFEMKIKKDNPEFFKKLLKKCNLKSDNVVYFDHLKENLEGANKAGIKKTKHYRGNIKEIQKFIDSNLYYYKPLKQKNVDTGMGVERTIAVLQGKKDVYETETFKPIIDEIEHLSGKSYKNNKKSMRIIADHIKASVFILAEGILPGNVEHGYVLRRLIRRAVRYGKKLGIKNFTKEVAEPVFNIYDDYSDLRKNKKQILEELEKEEKRFLEVIEKGLDKFNKLASKKKKLGGKEVFLLYQSYGFPIELTQELAKEKRIAVDMKGFEKEQKKHQELSRTATKGKFRAGLADYSKITTKLHTATHLLHAALRKILRGQVRQMGSNITSERLRFDFTHPKKLTPEEIKKVENLVNKQIKKGLNVKFKEMPYKKAVKTGALSFFREKYPEIVGVYSVGDFSKEICAGPHIKNTKEIGRFKILKESSSAAGVRRIKAVVE